MGGHSFDVVTAYHAYDSSMGGITLQDGAVLQMDPKGVTTVCLPKTMLALLTKPPVPSTSCPQDHTHPTSLLVAGTSTTDHILPDKLAFISYRPVSG